MPSANVNTHRRLMIIGHITDPLEMEIVVPPSPIILNEPTEYEQDEDSSHADAIITSVQNEAETLNNAQLNDTENTHSSLFQLEEEERNNMQQLFENAMLNSPSHQCIENSGCDNLINNEENIKDKLRSAQHNLQWNPEMNGEMVLVEPQ